MPKYSAKQRGRGPTQKKGGWKASRGPMSTRLIRQPMLVDHALSPLNYATYDFNYVQPLLYGTDAVPGGRVLDLAFARF